MSHRAARTAVSMLLAVVVLAPTAAASSAPATAASPADAAGAPGWAAGRILVGYDTHATAADKRRARTSAGATHAKPLQGVAGVEVVETRLGVRQAIGRLRGASGVRYAEPDYVVQASLVPNDPRFHDEWGLDQPGGVDINAPAAWDISTGAGTVVAVIDTGVQLDHPDLAGNLWTNPGEIAGNGIDDDDDGYVDDVHGWDFVQDDNQPQDANGHGTHVAGTIAAIGNNGVGVTGVAFGSRVMPLRMLAANGSGYLSDGVRALAFAKAHGVRVANLSWTFSGIVEAPVSQPLWDVIESAGEAGMVVVAAAGNHGLDADRTPEYPAGYDLPAIVSVAALAPNGTLASFSNRGISNVDIAAPGEQILSTYLGGTYAFLDGTSMASPHVAGVAALLVSAHPDWNAAQVKDRLLETAHPLGALAGLVGTGGLLDAQAALAPGSDRGPAVAITAPAAGARVQPGTPVTLQATASDPEDGNVGSSIAWHSSLMGALGTGATLRRADLVMGTHLIVATAHDSAGHRRSETLVLRVTPPVSYVDEHADPRPASIGLAPDGTPVLAWTEDGAGTVVSRPDGSAWTHEIVSPSYADLVPDALVDPSGTAHVAIERQWKDVGAASDGGILVATDDGSGQGTGWTVDRVSEGCGDDATGCGIDVLPSLARAADGRLHVAWARIPIPGVAVPGNRPGLWHAVSHGDGAWTAERVVAATDIVSVDAAIGPDGSAHLAFWRHGGASDGLYHASDETGHWVVEQVAADPENGFSLAARVQAGTAGRVDIAWAGIDGVTTRSRASGAWQAPVAVTAQAATDLDLVREGSTLHLAFTICDDSGAGAGIGYAVDDGSGWDVATVDAGRDEVPRLAVDGDGHPHLAYSRVAPEREVRHATNGGSGWTTDVVDRGWSWSSPSVGVDAAGHHHLAMARTGTQPGVWYATDASGSWALERLTSVPPDGTVALVVAPDGSVAITYGEHLDASGDPVADPAIWLKTGTSGAWTTRRLASNTGDPGPAIARGSTGRLFVAWSTRVVGKDRIAVATNASGTWQTSYATTGSSTTADTAPSIAVDGAGRMHLAYQEITATSVNIRYVANASGPWVKGLVSSGADPRLQPRIALTPAGQLRVAYWIYHPGAVEGEAAGIRLAIRNGASWSVQTVTSSEWDSSPAIATDAQGHAHLLWARQVGYGICGIPFCPDAPGFRYWSDSAGFGLPRRVLDYADDGEASIVRGADGAIAGAFAAPGWHLGVIDLREPLPAATAPAVHLATTGTVPAGTSLLAITFSGTHAALFKLAQQVGSGAWQTVGAVNGATSRSVPVGLSPTTTRRFRVSAFDGLGRPGSTATGAVVRTWGRAETPGTGLAYAGSWATTTGTGFWGGQARFASSSSASVTWTVTAKEVALVALKGATQGAARVYVDGKLAATVSLHAGGTAYRQVVFRRLFASVGTHRLTVKPAGTGRVTVDGFLALR